MFWADSIQGPWDGGSDIAPQAENTYNSQNTYELTVKGSEQTTYIYMGDSWDSKGGADSNYVWLPMDIDTGWVFFDFSLVSFSFLFLLLPFFFSSKICYTLGEIERKYRLLT